MLSNRCVEALEFKHHCRFCNRSTNHNTKGTRATECQKMAFQSWRRWCSIRAGKFKNYHTEAHTMPPTETVWQSCQWRGQMTEHQLCESDQGFPCRSSQAGFSLGPQPTALTGYMLCRCSGQRPLLSPTVLCTDSSTESQRCSASNLTLSSEPVCHWAL